MANFAELVKSIDKGSNYSTYKDAATPEGFFGATAKILGITRAYLLEGELNAPDAEIKGVVVIDTSHTAIAYKGSGLLGGYFMGRAESFEKAFADMIAE